VHARAVLRGVLTASACGAARQVFDWLERNAHVRLSLLATYLISEVRRCWSGWLPLRVHCCSRTHYARMHYSAALAMHSCDVLTAACAAVPMCVRACTCVCVRAPARSRLC
jgi:hypothetical protein